MVIDFTGKRVLVTGGTRGIGRGIVEAFLEAGARVAVNGSTPESTAQALAELDAGDRAVAAPGSVGSVARCRAIVDAALDALGGLDVLVNNAGVDKEAPAGQIDEETWDRVVDTNLKGIFFTTQRALPALQASRGNIVNMASVLGLVGAVDESMYCATKAGIISLTRSFALEFAPDMASFVTGSIHVVDGAMIAD